MYTHLSFDMKCIQQALDEYNKQEWPLQHYDDYVEAELKLRKELNKVYRETNVGNAFWSTVGDGVFSNVNPETHRASFRKLYFIPNQGKAQLSHRLTRNEARITIRIECMYTTSTPRSGYIMDYTGISKIGL